MRKTTTENITKKVVFRAEKPGHSVEKPRRFQILADFCRQTYHK